MWFWENGYRKGKWSAYKGADWIIRIHVSKMPWKLSASSGINSRDQSQLSCVRLIDVLAFVCPSFVFKPTPECPSLRLFDIYPIPGSHNFLSSLSFSFRFIKLKMNLSPLRTHLITHFFFHFIHQSCLDKMFRQYISVFK